MAFVPDGFCTGWLLYQMAFVPDGFCTGWLLYRKAFKQAVISRKRNLNFEAVFMNGDELDTSASFTQLGLSLSSNLTWKTHIHSLHKHAS